MSDDVIVFTYFVNLSNKDNIKRAEMIRVSFEDIFRKSKKQKLFVVADISKLDNRDTFPHESRQILANIFKNPRISKFVGIGGSIYLKTVGAFVARMTGRSKDFRWVNSVEEAKEWFKK